MFDDRTSVMGVPGQLVVLAAAALGMAVGLVLLWRALPAVPDPRSFRATEPRAAGSGPARTARLAIGLMLATTIAVAAFVVSPLSCTTGAGQGGPYWFRELLYQPQIVIVPALVFGAGGWVALGDTEAGWRLVGLGLAVIAALVVLLVSVALVPACA
jgi:hypothetical protein